LDVPTPLHSEIRWFQEEIRLCEELIREVERDPSFGKFRARTLARLRATLASHRESLADLERQLHEQSDELPRTARRSSAP
jgi:hypothetical protein